ncbi:MAG: S8 family serine peptidase [Pyrinomonadaceae bacterium]
MNRNNFLGHLALALTVILVAAFAGQVRRWQKDWQKQQTEPRAAQPAQPNVDEASDSDEDGDEKEDEDATKAEVLVRFRAGTSEETIRNDVERFNDDLEDEIESVQGLEIIRAEDGEDINEVVKEYAALPEVEYAEPNFEIKAEPELGNVVHYDASQSLGENHSALGPNDPMFANQWALENTGQNGGKAQADIRAVKAWEKTKGSEKIVVAVLDTGVDYTHPDLLNNMWLRPANVPVYTDNELGEFDDIRGFSAIDDNPMDDNGHGTHCAGIIGAEGDNGFGIVGVNWKVEIMPLKFMNANGSGTTADAIECINYVIDRKNEGVNIRIISASWGSRMKSKALEDAIRKAGDAGILFVAASGNDGANSDKTPHYPAGYNLPNVVSVAAMTRNDQLASFSNYGAKSVHIAAPGAEILSTWLNGSFEEHSGTSMATPVVSGVAALILSGHSNLSVEELRERLFKSVDKLDSLNGKVSTGGRLNAAKAVGAD